MNTSAASPASPASGSRLLDTIGGPADVKGLSATLLPQLAQEIRDEIKAVARKGAI